MVTVNRFDTALIDPGKPWQSSTAESFNGKLRDDCLSVEWFRSRAEAKIIIESWRQHYNAVKPHMSMNYLTPYEFKSQHSACVIIPQSPSNNWLEFVMAGQLLMSKLWHIMKNDHLGSEK